VIVGGGIIGLATAYKLLANDRSRRVIVLEKEAAVAQHQSGHNSGVLHAGLYYAPGSLKARLAVDGIRQMKAFCREFGVPHEVCGKLVVATPNGNVDASYLINCAGLHCDRVARLAGEAVDLRIVPFRGEYFTLRPDRRALVNHLVYPVPDPAFPFLGVHFTRTIGGDVEAGPNAVLALAREGYRATRVNLRDAADALLFPGLWRFLRRYPSMVGYELRRSFSRRRFCASLQRLVPELQEDDLAPGGAGVRAQAVASDGTLIQDFVIRQSAKALHLLNAPSPGATASLAIADVLVSSLGSA